MQELHLLYVCILYWSLKDKHSPVPVISPVDPIDRPIEFTPTKAPYDPRWMLTGRVHPSKCIKCTQSVNELQI